MLAVLKWRDEQTMLAEVSAVPYGLTCAIWTNDLNAAHRTALAVDAGFVRINDVSGHFLGAPFGGSNSPASDARNASRNCSAIRGKEYPCEAAPARAGLIFLARWATLASLLAGDRRTPSISASCAISQKWSRWAI